MNTFILSICFNWSVGHFPLILSAMATYRRLMKTDEALDMIMDDGSDGEYDVVGLYEQNHDLVMKVKLKKKKLRQIFFRELPLSMTLN